MRRSEIELGGSDADVSFEVKEDFEANFGGSQNDWNVNDRLLFVDEIRLERSLET
jgi:hypothetical protein